MWIYRFFPWLRRSHVELISSGEERIIQRLETRIDASSDARKNMVENIVQAFEGDTKAKENDLDREFRDMFRLGREK